MLNGYSRKKHYHFNSKYNFSYTQRNKSPILTPKKNLIENYQIQNQMNKTLIHSQVPYIIKKSNLTENINHYQKTQLLFPISSKVLINTIEKNNKTLLSRSPVQSYKVRRNISNIFNRQINSNNLLRYIPPSPWNLTLINNINLNTINNNNNNTMNKELSLYQTSIPSINIEKREQRLLRTPEPRRNININNIKSRNHKTSFSNILNNSSNLNNYNSTYSNKANTPLNIINICIIIIHIRYI